MLGNLEKSNIKLYITFNNKIKLFCSKFYYIGFISLANLLI